jgi:hypothetical protein
MPDFYIRNRKKNFLRRQQDVFSGCKNLGQIGKGTYANIKKGKSAILGRKMPELSPTVYLNAVIEG